MLITRILALHVGRATVVDMGDILTDVRAAVEYDSRIALPVNALFGLLLVLHLVAGVTWPVWIMLLKSPRAELATVYSHFRAEQFVRRFHEFSF